MNPRKRWNTWAELSIAILIATCPVAFSATNTATGDIAGDTNALQNSAAFNLSSTGAALPLVKRVFLEDGTPVPSGNDITSGSVVKFMLYIHNDTALQLQNISIRDVLDPAFVYKTGTIKFDNSQSCAALLCTGPEETDIYNAVNGVGAATDAAGAGDPVSFTSGAPEIIDAGRAAVPANDAVNILGSRVWAMLFTVTVQ